MGTVSSRKGKVFRFDRSVLFFFPFQGTGGLLTSIEETSDIFIVELKCQEAYFQAFVHQISKLYY